MSSNNTGGSKGILKSTQANNWVQSQAKTFLAWINLHLKKRGRLIEGDLAKGFESGENLCHLLEILTNKKMHIPFAKDPKFLIHKIQNNSIAIDFIKMEHIKLINVGGSDIVSGNQRAILGLIWTLILKYQIMKGYKNFAAQTLAASKLDAANSSSSNLAQQASQESGVKVKLTKGRARIQSVMGAKSEESESPVLTSASPLVQINDSIFSEEIRTVSESPQTKTTKTSTAQQDDGLNAKQALLQWIQDKLILFSKEAFYSIIQATDFTSCWCSGYVLNALIYRLKPEVFEQDFIAMFYSGNFEEENSVSHALQRNSKAVEKAEAFMDIPKLVEAEDISMKPEELSMMTYISFFRDYDVEKNMVDAASQNRILQQIQNLVARFKPKKKLEEEEELKPLDTEEEQEEEEIEQATEESISDQQATTPVATKSDSQAETSKQTQIVSNQTSVAPTDTFLNDEQKKQEINTPTTVDTTTTADITTTTTTPVATSTQDATATLDSKSSTQPTTTSSPTTSESTVSPTTPIRNEDTKALTTEATPVATSNESIPIMEEPIIEVPKPTPNRLRWYAMGPKLQYNSTIYTNESTDFFITLLNPQDTPDEGQEEEEDRDFEIDFKTLEEEPRVVMDLQVEPPMEEDVDVIAKLKRDCDEEEPVPVAKVSYLPKESGIHLIHLKLNGQHIDNSPIAILVKDRVDPTQCFVSQFVPCHVWNNSTTITNSLLLHCNNQERKLVGMGGNLVQVQVSQSTATGKKEEEKLLVQVLDQQDGTYWITYQISSPGKYLITITVDGQVIATCPLEYNVYLPIAPEQSKLTPNWKDRVFVGEECTCTLLTKDKDGNSTMHWDESIDYDTWKVQVLFTNNTKPQHIPCQIKNLLNGEYNISFVATHEGKYELQCMINSKSLPSCTVQALPSISSVYSFADGPGLEGVNLVSKQDGQFYVEVRDSKNKTVLVEATEAADDALAAAINNQVERILQYDKEWNSYLKKQYSESEKSKQIQQQQQLERSRSVLRRESMMKSVKIDPLWYHFYFYGEMEEVPEEEQLTINPLYDALNENVVQKCKKAFPFEIFIKNMSIADEPSLPFHLLYVGRGKYLVSYTPVTAGDYMVSVYRDKEDEEDHIRGSPFHVSVTEALDTKLVDVFGPGLLKAYVGTPSQICIRGLDKNSRPIRSGGHYFSLIVRDCFDRPCTGLTYLEDDGTGTYKAYYTPLVAGTHTVRVKYEGMEVKGSPFKVLVREASEKPDSSHCTVAGFYPLSNAPDDLKSIFSIIANTPNEFLLKAKNARNVRVKSGRDIVEAFYYRKYNNGGFGRLIDAEVIDHENGTYTIRYEPPELGEYQMDIKVNGQSIKDFPTVFFANGLPDHQQSQCSNWKSRFYTPKGIPFNVYMQQSKEHVSTQIVKQEQIVELGYQLTEKELQDEEDEENQEDDSQPVILCTFRRAGALHPTTGLHIIKQ